MPVSRRSFLATTALVPFSRSARAAAGRFAPFDKLLSDFLVKHKVPGAALAVSHNREVVHSRGFGIADLDSSRKVETHSLFRIASISKPITAAAVLQLVDAGKVGLDDPVLKHVHIRPRERLDPRWHMITVRHCLHHTGGWDRDRSGDPIGMPWKIAGELGIQVPVPLENVIRYTMGLRLDFDPGTRYAYSNVGYLLLGRVIAEASGRHYEEYVRKEVLAPLGIANMELGRALPEHRAKNEVSYYDSKRSTGRCLYAPRVRERVPFPDGAGNLEAYEAHGGWIASAPDLVKFASAFDWPSLCPILSRQAIRKMWERPGGGPGSNPDLWYGCGWSVRPQGKNAFNTWHTGLISGTSTLLVRRFDGWNWAVLFNTDRSPDGKVLAGLIDPLLHQAADEVIRSA